MTVLKVHDSIQSIAPDDWDACTGRDHPFVRHAFFDALESSGSACTRTGWQPLHLSVDLGDGLAGVAPAYVKNHSQGEYVFDHGWADAFTRAGGRYYPKLQVSVPFTPVTGPRLMTRLPEAAPFLIAGLQSLAEQNSLSSVHATFLQKEQAERLEAAGWLIRMDQQFHWKDAGYADFEGFLGALASRKRKAIRKERSTAMENGIQIRWHTGADITEAHWDAFWVFYQDTGARKWGQPYLTRRFFSMLSEAMADAVLLVFAYRDGRPIAGALNLIGADTLYGRYWGAIEDHPCLHFEVCYYQAIDFALAQGLKRVEAGAQGEHKLARGYVPTPTWSAHWIAHPGLRRAVADFLAHERRAMTDIIAELDAAAPFRRSQD